MSYRIIYNKRNSRPHVIRNVDYYELVLVNDGFYYFYRDNIVVWTEKTEDVKAIKSEEE